MAKRVVLQEDGEQIFPYVGPDTTLSKKNIPAESKAVGERIKNTTHVFYNNTEGLLYDNYSLQEYIKSGKFIDITPNNFGSISSYIDYSIIIFPVISGHTYVVRGMNIYPNNPLYVVYYYTENPENGGVFSKFGYRTERQTNIFKFTVPDDITYICIGLKAPNYNFTNSITIEEFSSYSIDYGTYDKIELFTQSDIENTVKIKRKNTSVIRITNSILQRYIYNNKVYNSQTGLNLNFTDIIGYDTVCVPVKPYSVYTIFNKVWNATNATVFNLVFYDEFPVNGNVNAVCGIKITEESESYTFTIPPKVTYMCFVVKSPTYDGRNNIYIEYTDYTEEFVDSKGNHININFEDDEVQQSSITYPIIDNGLPCDVPIVRITSNLLSPNANNNTIPPLTYSSTAWKTGDPVGSVDTEDVRLEFISNTINFVDYIEINYQGATSLADEKKGFGIDMANKHRFGKWQEFDSFHLKAYYEDFSKCRDLACNMLMEQIYQTRDCDVRRPFMKHNDFNNKVDSFFSSNAYCHVEGFPVELYINDIYWGLYVWRSKKHRDNYMFSKNNTNHIFIDTQDFFTNGFQWSGVEIRNPKSDSGNSKFEEGVEPNDGEVKTAVTAWKDFMWGITLDTPKSDIEEHFNISEFIDVYLLLLVTNTWDSWSRNTLYGTWDGQHFSPMVYDMNNSFNGFGGKSIGSYTAYYPPTSNTYNQKARSIAWFPILESLYDAEIKARYKELKRLGIFTAENIIGIFEYYINIVGWNVYKRDANRWPNCPSLIANNRDYDSIKIIGTWIKERIQYVDSLLLI